MNAIHQVQSRHRPPRQTYRGLLQRGLQPSEAGNLVAHRNGLQICAQRWSLSEVNALLFLRYLRHDARQLGGAEFEASGLGRRDDARWSGALEIIPTKADTVLDLIRANSLWPLLSGLACCAIEMISTATSKHDMDRFGWFPFRASPRQADVLIVAGTGTTKMAGPLIRLWDQMPEPKWCVALGDCTCSGGRYKRSYSTIEWIDRVMPVDVYVPGCPPRPEGLIYAFLKLQQLIKDRRGHWPDRAIGPTVPDGIWGATRESDARR
jgi:NADH-quinone oxidoreductase subunit B